MMRARVVAGAARYLIGLASWGLGLAVASLLNLCGVCGSGSAPIDGGRCPSCGARR